jgi:hypothetical protein
LDPPLLGFQRYLLSKNPKGDYESWRKQQEDGLEAGEPHLSEESIENEKN